MYGINSNASAQNDIIIPQIFVVMLGFEAVPLRLQSKTLTIRVNAHNTLLSSFIFAKHGRRSIGLKGLKPPQCWWEEGSAEIGIGIPYLILRQKLWLGNEGK